MEVLDRLGVLRLHAGDHPQLPKAGDVGGSGRLNVLDPVAARRIAGLEGIESVPDGTVADGVDFNLPAAGTRRLRCRGQLARLPARLPDTTRSTRIRLEQ